MIRTTLTTMTTVALALAAGGCAGEQGPVVVDPVIASSVTGSATPPSPADQPPAAAASECGDTDPAALADPLPDGRKVTDLVAGDATAEVWTAEANGTQYWWAQTTSGAGYLTATWGPGSDIAYTCVRGPGVTRTPAVPWKLPGATQGSLPNNLQFCLSAWSAPEPACWAYS